MLVALDGDVEALGWVTGLTKDLVENLKLAAAGFPLMKVTRTLVCRETKENSSKARGGGQGLARARDGARDDA